MFREANGGVFLFPHGEPPEDLLSPERRKEALLSACLPMEQPPAPPLSPTAPCQPAEIPAVQRVRSDQSFFILRVVLVRGIGPKPERAFGEAARQHAPK